MIIEQSDWVKSKLTPLEDFRLSLIRWNSFAEDLFKNRKRKEYDISTWEEPYIYKPTLKK